eukprot:TRINITY_DN37507_c0_g1_i1.p1 TRINITY_DN37507_c0_g1~~TRINITY_DN37507_c0_g1_i1.p1  ORF type:complete len:100 (-),score=1.52 TRINITY_DN37507_c0_g1_i1:179-478(-)
MFTVIIMTVFYINVLNSDFDIIIHLEDDGPWSLESSQPDAPVCRATNGGRCQFPFIYEGQYHYKCLPHKDRFWCMFNYYWNNVDTWGYCDRNCPTTETA